MCCGSLNTGSYSGRPYRGSLNSCSSYSMPGDSLLSLLGPAGPGPGGPRCTGGGERDSERRMSVRRHRARGPCAEHPLSEYCRNTTVSGPSRKQWNQRQTNTLEIRACIGLGMGTAGLTESRIARIARRSMKSPNRRTAEMLCVTW